MSPAGRERVTKLSEDFAEDVTVIAGRIAYRLMADEASADHVDTAAEQIYQGVTSRREEAQIALGGVVSGLAGGAFIAYTQAATINGTAVVASVVALVGGIVVMLIGLRRR